MDDAVKELKRLQGVVARLAQNAGIDQSNPQRGINAGATPSVKNPVDQKLSSLADVQTYNVLDKQVLSWSQQGQKWLPVTPSAGGGGGGGISIPEAIAGFTDATGYGFLPTVTDGPYSVLAQNGAFDGDGVFNLVTCDSRGGINSVRSGYEFGLELESTDAVNVRAGDRTGQHTWAKNFGYQIALNAFQSSDESVYGVVEVHYDNCEMSAYGATRSSVIGVTEDCAYVSAPFLRPPYCTTATRPTVGLDVGAHVYDTTIKKPIWYDYAGSTWRDALGTAV
jgi:hypothetical protein